MVHLYFPMACMTFNLVIDEQRADYFFLIVLMISITCFVCVVSLSYSLFSRTDLVISLLPMPTAQTPLSNHDLIFSAVVSTPPVGINNNPWNNSFIAVT